LTAAQYFDEKKSTKPKLISLAGGYTPALRRDFTVSLDGLESAAVSRSPSGLLQDDSSLKEENKRLRAENGNLRAELEELKARLNAQ
jgi:hypothetical protein